MMKTETENILNKRLSLISTRDWFQNLKDKINRRHFSKQPPFFCNNCIYKI